MAVHQSEPVRDDLLASRISELEAQGARDRETIANLESALATARRIGAAIGILMSTHRITEDDAFALLRRASQQEHVKVHVVADRVLLTGTIG